MHVMADIETWGTRPGDAVFQIGAVAFELNGTVLEPHELLQYEDRWFNMRVADYGGNKNADTVYWWADDDRKPAYDRIAVQDEHPLADTLNRFNRFVEPWLGKRGFMWARGPRFDFGLLRAAYDCAGIEPAWAFNQEHDARTLSYTASKIAGRAFVGPDMSGLGLVKHFALHDAVVQAVTTQAAWRCLQSARRH